MWNSAQISVLLIITVQAILNCILPLAHKFPSLSPRGGTAAAAGAMGAAAAGAGAVGAAAAAAPPGVRASGVATAGVGRVPVLRTASCAVNTVGGVPQTAAAATGALR